MPNSVVLRIRLTIFAVIGECETVYHRAEESVTINCFSSTFSILGTLFSLNLFPHIYIYIIMTESRQGDVFIINFY